MPSHCWGDDWKYWDDLNEVVGWMWTNSRRWGRIGGDIKEKYGTLRFYVKFHSMFQDLFYPGYCRNMWPNWAFRLDMAVYMSKYNPIRWLIQKYQFWVYKLLYRRAVAKWPHISDEIVCDADVPELLDPSIQKIHWKHWTRVE